MTESTRKRAKDREKELRLAMLRIDRGRAQTKATKISIASVAREAGVSTALIHNHYPNVAEDIRAAVGRSSRDQRDAKQNELNASREIERLELLVKNLASENEVLIAEKRELKAIQNAENVEPFPSLIGSS
jgi:AcrR family transcriptional regulator